MAATDIRPMSLGEVLDRTFSLYKNNFMLLSGIVAVPMLVQFVYAMGLEWFQRLAVAGSGRGAPSVGVIITGAIGVIVAALIMGVLVSAAQAGTIVAVSEIYLGRTITVKEAYRPVRKRIFRFLGLILVTGLMCGAGLIFLFIPGIYLYCKTALVTPVMMLEDESVGGSISRSFDLTKDYVMQIFLILLLVFVIKWVVGMILVVPVTIAVAAMHLKTVPIWMAVLQHLGEFLSEVVITPIGTISISLMYYNLRVRKEAFDLQHLMGSLDVPPNSPNNAPSVA